jgi:hypothetical protein
MTNGSNRRTLKSVMIARYGYARAMKTAPVTPIATVAAKYL